MMNYQNQIKKYACELKAEGLPTSLCPYVGQDYSKSLILIVSEAIIIKDAELSIVATPFDRYKNADLFYKGGEYSEEQEKEISFDSFVDSIRKYLNSGCYNSVDYDDFKNHSGEEENKGLLEKIAYILSKSQSSIDDVAIHRFFLRPYVVARDIDINNFDYSIEDYYKEIDINRGVENLKKIMDALCPQKIYFASKKLADVVSNAFAVVYPKEYKEYFKKNKKVLTDIDSTWDVDKKRLDEILENQKLTGQKRLRVLIDKLVDIEEGIRKGEIEKEKGLDDLRVIVENIRANVSKHKGNLTKCGRVSGNKLSDNPESREYIDCRNRMAEARKKRWVKIRTEQPEDFKTVENLTREAFWNVYRPGCIEHYVLHCYRNEPNFVPKLSLVMEIKGEIIGHVMYAWSYINTDDGRKKRVMTFGPISIRPDYQRKGYGKILLDHSMRIAAEMGASCLLIRGDIKFFGKCGFIPAIERGIRYAKDPEATDLLCKELDEGFGITGTYSDPEPYFVAMRNPEAFEKYDAEFPPKEKLVLPEQLR